MKTVSKIIAVTVLVAAVGIPAHAAPASAATPASLFAGGLYVQPDSRAALAAPTLTDATQVAAARYISRRSVAIWLGDWLDGAKLTSYIDKNVSAAESAGTTPVFVTYAIPDRDCGGYSAGGFTADHYAAWNALVADALKGHRSVVIVEPDSIEALDKCSSATVAARLPQLKSAIQQFADAGVPAYLDGGLSNAVKASVMATRLKAAGIASARGFFTNVANYRGVDPERAYADSLSALVGGAHYVIDVSRNGRGYSGTWCNAPGAGLGQDPHASAGTTNLDALLWIKSPGSSDGTCNGGPAAGTWFPSYAASLVALRKK